jgi:predicted ATP-grasp superfamily ATP-dependent carboligase
MTNDQPKGRVILTHARSLQALAAARSLASRGIEVVGADDAPLTVLSFSRHVKDTFVLPPEHDVSLDVYLDELTASIAEHAPPPDVPYVLMPINWRTRLYAQHRERLERHIRVATPDFASIDRVDPKHHLIETAAEAGVPIPQTKLVVDGNELDEVLAEFEFPLFLKLPDSAGGVGITRANDAEELRKKFADFSRRFELSPERPLLVQAAAPGEDYCTTALARGGELVAHMTYRNLRQFPTEGGIGVVRETVEDGALAKYVARLVAHLGWNGVAQFDFRWTGDADDEPKLIEVNPRFWGGLHQSIASGIDYPWMLWQMTVGEPIDEPGEATVGTRTRIPLTSQLSAIEEFLTDDSVFEGLERLWGAARDHVSKAGLDGLWDRVAPIFRSESSAQDERRLRLLDELSSAAPEGFAADDPYTGLGVLFVLGSLLRRGRLPEELGRTGARSRFGERDDGAGESSGA